MLNCYWSTGLLFLVNARLPDNIRGLLGIHSLTLNIILLVCSVSYVLLIHSINKLSKYLVAGTSLQDGKKCLKLLRTEMVSASHAPIPFQLFIT